MHRPLVSVILPTRNRAGLLGGAIASVLAQEGAGTLFDLETIVVDDASTDATPDVARQYPDVKYIRLDHKQNVSVARNVGITASTGQYLAFLDDDDMWLPHRLRVQVPIFEAQPEIGVIYGQGIVVTETGHTTIWPATCPSGRVFETFLTLSEDIHNVDTWLVRRTAFEAAGLFDEFLPTLEHNDMALRLAFHVAWKFVPGPVCYGRLLAGGMWVTNIRNGVAVGALRRVVDRALDLLPRAQYDRLQHEARAAGLAMLAEQLWHFGGLSAVRDHVRAVAHEAPEMLETASIRVHLYRVARELASLSAAPIAAIHDFGEDLRNDSNGKQTSVRIRQSHKRLVGDLLAEAAAALWESNSPRLAVYVGGHCLLQDLRHAHHRLVGAVRYAGKRVLHRMEVA
ncbi:MAG: glycosyltransferase family 2 protein [Nitrospiraceae bacterium]|nr:glycosyltransferase family 2 protein [Nitrospiraceae bacterium]